MKIINLIKLYWKRIKKEVYQSNLSYWEIRKFLKDKFPDCHIEVTDIIKGACDYNTLKGLAQLIPVKYLKYKKEERDCDDFTFIALGVWKALFPRLPIGLCFVKTNGSKHALLIALYKRNGLVGFSFLEPQSNKLSVYSNYSPYLIVI